MYHLNWPSHQWLNTRLIQLLHLQMNLLIILENEVLKMMTMKY